MSPLMEKKLLRWVMGIWPKTYKTAIVKGNKFYPSLLAFAEAEGIGPIVEPVEFLIEVKFDFVGFRLVEQKWKAVYQARENVSCTMVDGEDRFQLNNRGKYFLENLLVMSNVATEVLIDIPQVEEAIAVRKPQGRPEFSEKYWRFAIFYPMK